MRILLALSLLLSSLSLVFASEDAEIKNLFLKYEMILDEHNTELVEEVFSKNFLSDNGGKDGFSKKIKTAPKRISKERLKDIINWRKGLMDEIYFAQFKPKDKKSKDYDPHTEFIIIKEDGKFKIDGTLSDAE